MRWVTMTPTAVEGKGRRESCLRYPLNPRIHCNRGPRTVEWSAGRAEVELVMSSRAEIDRSVRGQTVLSRFGNTVAGSPEKTALRWRAGDDWRDWSWSQYADLALRVATGVRALGLRRGDRVAIMTRNRPEFHVADMGVLLAGGVPVSLFSASSPEQVRVVTQHAGATFAIVENNEALGKLSSVERSSAGLREVVTLEDVEDDSTFPYSSFLREQPMDLEEAISRAGPEEPVTICYTSGTTGAPKGVVIAHRTVCWWIESMLRGFAPRAPRRGISYLPMTTMLERLASHYLPAATGAEITTCPDPLDVASYLREIRPQYFAGVPRVWDRIRSGIHGWLAEDPGKLESLEMALAASRRARVARPDDPAAGEITEAYARAEASTLRPLRALVGLDCCEIAVIGAAPIPEDLADFFLALGVPLSGSYGLTECTAAVNQFGARKPGRVGTASPGCEIRLLDDGEILCRGGSLFDGYLDDPAATREVLDGEGWFHTGDVGEIEPDGQLKIIDRKKELIVTPDGRNVSPAALEGALTASRFVAQACVLGDQRPYLAALIVPEWTQVRLQAAEEAADRGAEAEAASWPDLRNELQLHLDKVNALFSSAERIERFTVLESEWTAESGELTPTLKLKRRVILAKYADEIAKLYPAEPDRRAQSGAFR